MEQLKETIESLRTERDNLLEEQQPLQEKLQSFEAEKAAWQQSRMKLIDQAKERNRLNLKENKERTAERDTAIQEKEVLQEQLTALQQELETAVQDKVAAEQQLTSLNQELEMVKTERDRALANASAIPQPPITQAATSQSDPTLDQQLTELRQELDQVKQEKDTLEAQLKSLAEQLEKSNSERDNAIAEAREAKSKKNAQTSDSTMENETEDGQIDESPNAGLADEERNVLEQRIAAAEAKVKEAEEKAAHIEEGMEAKLKERSERMKTALNKKLTESREAQKAEAAAEAAAEFNLRLEQEKQIWLAENKAAQPPDTPLGKVASEESKPVNGSTPATPAAPATPNPKVQLANLTSNMSESEIREWIGKNPTAQAIMKHNITKLAGNQTQKLKDEYAKETQRLVDENAKALADAAQKAEAAKINAVTMEGKKSALKINMSDNKAKTATGKLEVVEKAAQETPERPVGEVWEEVKVWKPVLPPTALAAPTTPIPATGTSFPDYMIFLKLIE